MPSNRQILLKSRPTGAPSAANFELVQTPAPEPKDGEVLLKTLYLSLDPYMRGRMSDGPSYAAPAEVGKPMVGGTVSQIVASRKAGLAEGDVVGSYVGWQDYAVSDGTGLTKLDPQVVKPLSLALGLLGMPGMTAYAGLMEIGQPKPGETVVVSAASGAVGSVVGQLAKLKGCRAVGIAGGAAKCRHVVETLGFDACVDHQGENLRERIAAACPKGIDVYFENVGGAVQRALWPMLNNFSRVPVCGLIAQYNEPAAQPGPDLRSVLTKRLTVRGFIVTELWPKYPNAFAELAQWYHQGKIKYR
ncbi:MAG TPA: NADP-dependent oxidoreductase, partial [Stellaceae bacterium]|nr:NADP-dependent oxidoreductase [Stellaceae bacterium]